MAITGRTAEDAVPRFARRAVVALMGLTIAVAACGGGGASSSPAASAASTAPSGAPESTAPESVAPSAAAGIDPALVAAAEAEGGTLDIYSNTSEENWTPIFEAFKAEYPFITSISANDLGSEEVFERYLAESSAGSSAADMLVTNATTAWAAFAGRDGVLADYAPAALADLPEFATLLPNVYAMSTDPQTLTYNTSLLTTPPTGLASLAEIVSADPTAFNDKITFRDVEGSFGFAVSHGCTTGNPDVWTSLEKILPLSRPEDSSGTQVEKLTTGEYLAGFFISGAVSFPAVEDAGGLLAAIYPDDCTVVLPRGIGITATAPHPNTAKLFLEFVLSQSGQEAVSTGGLTAYRPGITGERTYQALEAEVGADAIILVEFENLPESEITGFVERWNGLAAQ